MLRRIREQLGTAGLVVAVIALIAALGGAAYAASGGLTAKQKKEVKSIARSFQGKGPQGAAGNSGTNGKDGAQGPAGQVGSPGKVGSNGSSILVTPVPAGELECEGRGGAVLEEEQEPAAAAEVCTGEEGEAGPEGSFGGSPIKAGVTEKGGWAVTGSTADTSGVYAAISFPSPLAANIGATSEKFHIFTDADFAAKCTGTIGSPTAPEGELCVYGEGTNLTKAEIWQLTNSSNGASKGGALLFFEFSAAGIATGSWAVTG